MGKVLTAVEEGHRKTALANMKRIYCYETDTIYPSMNDAAADTDAHAAAICRCCKGLSALLTVTISVMKTALLNYVIGLTRFVLERMVINQLLQLVLKLVRKLTSQVVRKHREHLVYPIRPYPVLLLAYLSSLEAGVLKMHRLMNLNTYFKKGAPSP